MSAPAAPVRARVAAFVPYARETTPSQRFRIEQWAPYLADAGIEVELISFADDELTALLPQPGRMARKARLVLRACARNLRRARALPPDRVVFVHRGAWLAGPPVVERQLRRRGHPLLYDFDDAIFRLHTSDSNKALAWLKQPSKTAALCRLSDRVVVGNAYLADWARPHNPAVRIVPTSVDTDRCRPRGGPRPAGPVVVGWTGSSTSQTYLEAFAPMLRALADSETVELRVLSTREPDLPGIPHSWRRWTPQNEDAEIAAFDVGIMPMPDEEWAKGKCALKALQYMSAGVATVASAIGANREVIEHGRNGLLASTTADWLDALRSLARDDVRRCELGAAGRRTVEERYSMRSSARRLEDVVLEVADRRGSA